MKNIQVIDGAMNCTYSLFGATDAEFEAIFPGGCDVEFADDLSERLGETACAELLGTLWKRAIDKKVAQGIHGTLFFGLDFKKRYYPTKRESEMVTR